MSKEERIQEQVAEKLGFRVYLDGDQPMVSLSESGASDHATFHEIALWEALIAAETKLEPQTVAETIDWEIFLDPAYYDLWCVRRVGSTKFGDGFHVTSKAEAEGLLAELSHSSAPDTKGLETALEQSLALLKECDAALVSHHEMGFVSRFVKSGTCEICSKGIFWKLPKVKSEAESALTSYREKRK